MERLKGLLIPTLLLLPVLWWCLPGCTPGEVDDPDDPPPPTTTIPPGPPSEPPCALPAIGRGERRCYVAVEAAGVRRDKPITSTGILQGMMFVDQELVATSRNFLGVSQTCAVHLGKGIAPYFIEAEDLIPLAKRGFVLHDGGRETGETRAIKHPSMLSFVGEGEGKGRLQLANRRCQQALEPPDPWCGRTGVFRPALQGFRTDARAHMNVMRSIDGRAGHLGFDGIRAWCAAQ